MKKLAGIALLAVSLFGGDIKVFTEEYPPYNMKVNGELKGLSVEVLDAMYKKMGNKNSANDSIHTNWARAYNQALKKPDTMVFSTTRTAAREDLFKWVGPITKTTIGVVAPKNKNITINNDTDLSKYKIGVVSDDIGEVLLKEKGVNKKSIMVLKGKNAVFAGFKKMSRDNIDGFAYETKVCFDKVKKDGFKKSDYKIVYTLKEGELYFAFNKSTSDAVINKWQKALDAVKADGTLKSISSKY